MKKRKILILKHCS